MAPPAPTPLAFVDLYPLIAQHVRRYVRQYHLGGQGVAHRVSEDEIDDVTQDALLAVSRAWASYDPTRPLLPWLKTIARRAARAHLKRARGDDNAGDADLELVADDGAPTAEEQTLAGERFKILRELLRPMDEDRRIVFTLYDLDGFGMTDIAEAMMIPVDTAWSRLRRIRLDLEQGIKRQRKGPCGPLLGLACLADLARDAGDAGDPAGEWDPNDPLNVAAPAPDAKPETEGLARRGVRAGKLVPAHLLGAGLLGLLIGVAVSAVLRPTAAEVERAAPPSRAVGGDVGAEAPRAAPSPEVGVVVPTPTPGPAASSGSVGGRVARAASPPGVASQRGLPVPTPAIDPLPGSAVPSPVPLDPVSAEDALIRKARRALGDGDLEVARAALDDHQRSFPGGQMISERETLRARLRDAAAAKRVP
jgi:RNA polymerase sigma factor (sigma-70 family)